MIFKLGMSAERNWKRLRGFQWLATLIEGVKFRDGVEVRTNMSARAQRQTSKAAA